MRSTTALITARVLLALAACLFLPTFAAAQISVPPQSRPPGSVQQPPVSTPPPASPANTPPPENLYQQTVDAINRSQPPGAYPRSIRIDDLPPALRDYFHKYFPGRKEIGPPMLPTTAPGVERFGKPRIMDGWSRVDRSLEELASEQDLWMRWWEVNRELYWPGPAPLRTDQDKPDDSTKPPQKVVAALNSALASKDNYIRSAAALSLGMLKNPDALTALHTLAAGVDDTVALHAWAGIGLLDDSPEVVKFLEIPPTRPRDLIGWMMAVGLQPKPSSATWTWVRKIADQTDRPEIKRLAVWAMRTHRAPGTLDLLHDILANSTDRGLCAEAMLGLGDFHEPDDAMLLADVVNSRKSARKVPSVDISIPFSRGMMPQPIGTWYQLQAMLALSGYDSVPDVAREAIRAPLASPSGQLTRAVHSSRWQRGNTGPGLFTPAGTPRQPQKLASADSYDIDHGFRLLALGKHAHPDDLALLIDTLQLRNTGIEARLENAPAASMNLAGILAGLQCSPSRGFAAVGLGLALRKLGPDAEADTGRPSVVTGRPIPVVPGVLVMQYQSNVELTGVRAASVLALGLSKNPAHARRIKDSLPLLQQGQEKVFGFTILALGMLKDPETLDWAAKCLGPPRDEIDVEKLLADDKKRRANPMPVAEVIWRRAAVDGLAALRDPRALPLLMAEWGKDDSLDLEIARAISCCRPFPAQSDAKDPIDPFVEAMLKLIAQEKSAPLAADAAACLGLLYQTDACSRLGTLMSGNDFTIAGVPLNNANHIDLARSHPRALLALANPFYYYVMPKSPITAVRP